MPKTIYYRKIPDHEYEGWEYRWDYYDKEWGYLNWTAFEHSDERFYERIAIKLGVNKSELNFIEL